MPRWEDVAPFGVLPLYLVFVFILSVLLLFARVWFRVVRYLFVTLPLWLHALCMYWSVALLLGDVHWIRKAEGLWITAEQRDFGRTWY